MKQSKMLFRLELKRAMKKLPELMLGAALISAVIAIIAVCSALLDKAPEEAVKYKVALVTNNNKLVENVGMEMLGGMETVQNLFEFGIYDEKTATDMFKGGELDGLIIFPDNYIDSIGRGDNDPAQVFVKSGKMSYSLSMIAETADAAGDLLGATEAASYALQDWCKEYSVAGAGAMIDTMDVTAARVILSREEMFNKVTVYGEGDTSIAQGYACSAVVILVLLWGLSCGTLLKSDSIVLARKLNANLIPTWKQMCMKLFALVLLLLTVFSAVAAAVLAAYARFPDVFKVLDITSIWQLVLLFAAFLPCLVLAATIVMFAYSAASNQIGGILLLFISTIVMSYISGCLLPSVYLPGTVRSLARFLPTTYMYGIASGALLGNLEITDFVKILIFALAFFTASVGIIKYKGNRL